MQSPDGPAWGSGPVAEVGGHVVPRADYSTRSASPPLASPPRGYADEEGDLQVKSFDSEKAWQPRGWAANPRPRGGDLEDEDHRLWSERDDDELRAAMFKLGMDQQYSDTKYLPLQEINWDLVAEKLTKVRILEAQGVKLTIKQIRDRWEQHLRPGLLKHRALSKDKRNRIIQFLEDNIERETILSRGKQRIQWINLVNGLWEEQIRCSTSTVKNIWNSYQATQARKRRVAENQEKSWQQIQIQAKRAREQEPAFGPPPSGGRPVPKMVSPSDERPAKNFRVGPENPPRMRAPPEGVEVPRPPPNRYNSEDGSVQFHMDEEVMARAVEWNSFMHRRAYLGGMPEHTDPEMIPQQYRGMVPLRPPGHSSLVPSRMMYDCNFPSSYSWTRSLREMMHSLPPYPMSSYSRQAAALGQNYPSQRPMSTDDPFRWPPPRNWAQNL